jgi:undecaprenyl pyrophosphate phosphatase UppP
LSTTGSDATRALAVSGGGAVAAQLSRAEDQMVVLFLLLVIAAIILGILGVVVKGLLYLLFTGIGVLLVAFFLGALWMRHRTRRRRNTR